MAQYGKLDYWEERYSRESEQFDWYQRWTGVRDVFNQFIAPNQHILHLGCGNSKMAEDMYEDGFLSSVNIDLSQTAVRQMQDRYRDKETLRFIHMDARKLEFEDRSFDVAIDKGTMDSILCSENSTAHTLKYISEVFRVLTNSGVFLIVSYGQPPQRVPYLTKGDLNWDVTVAEVPKPTIPTNPTATNDDKDAPNVHYIYICKKRGF